MPEQLTVAADTVDFIEVETSRRDVGRMIYVTASESGSYHTVLKPLRADEDKVVASRFEVRESEMIPFKVDMPPVDYIQIGEKPFAPMKIDTP